MKENKGKALIAALAAWSMLGMGTAFAASTVDGVQYPTRAEDGTLKWDFESTDDVAYADDWNVTNDTINSGAWHCTYVKKDGISGSPHSVKYADCPLSFGAGSGTTAELALPENNPIPENGGSGFVYVKTHQNAWAQYSGLGMSIKLSDTDLVPGKSYMVAADIYQTTSFGIDTMVSCTKPSEFSNSRTDWTKSTNKTYLTHEISDGKWASYVEQSEGWVRVQAEFTPSADMYENGSVILNIGNWSESYQSNKFVCFDNITITPVDKGWYTNSENKEPFAVQVKYGKSWNFEDSSKFKTGRTPVTVPAGKESQYEYDVTLTTAAGDYEDGTWAALPGYKDSYQEPRVINTADYTATNRYASSGSAATVDKGHHGLAPAGNYSIRCASRADWGMNDLVGTRVRLDKNDWLRTQLDYTDDGVKLTDSDASYTFKLKASNNTGSSATSWKGGLCAFVVPEEADNGANGFEQVKGWYDAARANGTLITLGELNPYWQEYTANITLKPSDFSADGYAELIVLSLYNSGTPAELGNFFPMTYLYLDDISLTRNDEVSIIDYMGKNMNIDLTNICLQEIPNVFTAISHYDYMTEEMISFDGNVSSMKGIDRCNLCIPITGDLTKSPETIIYMWNAETLVPVPIGRKAADGKQNIPVYTIEDERFGLSN